MNILWLCLCDMHTWHINIKVDVVYEHKGSSGISMKGVFGGSLKLMIKWSTYDQRVCVYIWS